MTVLEWRDVDRLVSPVRVEAPPRQLPPEVARRALMVICDASALLVSCAIAALIRPSLFGPLEGPASFGRSLLDQAPYTLVLLAAMGVYGLHGRSFRRVRRSWFLDFGQLTHSLLTGTVVTVALSSGLHRLTGLPKLGWVEAAVMSAPALLLVPAGRGLGSVLARRQGAVLSRVAVVGSPGGCSRLLRRLQRVTDIEVVGLVSDCTPDECDPDPDHPVRLLGETDDLLDICRRNRVDRIFVSASGDECLRLDGIIRRLPPEVHVCIVPTFSELLTWQSHVEDLDGMTIMEIPAAQPGMARRAAKRLLDVVVSAAALTALAPVLLVVAAAVKLTSAGPVLFRQTRIGHKSGPFSIVKFRTMAIGADSVKADLRHANEGDGPMFKIRNDPRITPVGRFLRRTSLDELPQFINVLVGQMSLVGPRPLVPEESICFDGWAARRFDVKPGMTGLWQVSGRSDLPFEEIRHLDYAYAASWSLWWDLKILWQTPASVLRARGAY